MSMKYDGLVKSRFCPFLSFPRRRESSYFNDFWIPAFAGMTVFRLFTTSSNIGIKKNLGNLGTPEIWGHHTSFFWTSSDNSHRQ